MVLMGEGEGYEEAEDVARADGHEIIPVLTEFTRLKSLQQKSDL